jgi:hypothetical protein
MPARLSRKDGGQALYPALASAARELASDNIMCAVMLTGVLFLQVSTEMAVARGESDCQAGRYYSKRSAKAAQKEEAEINAANVVADHSSSPIRRTSTPFRELTEQEAMELKGLDDSERPTRQRVGRTK